MIGLEPGERLFDATADRGGAAIDAAFVTIGGDAHFGTEEECVAPTLERLADQCFIVADAINIRGVEMVITNIERAAQQPDRIIL